MTQAAIERGQTDKQTTDRECVNHQYQKRKRVAADFQISNDNNRRISY